jgi:thiosulfate/3-mercaptopyruvate sulfurtransferase
LPESSAFGAFLGRIGWSTEKLLVAHDDRNNALAARLWWLMRYFGQDAALLNGGLEAWTRCGLPLQSGDVESEPGFAPELRAQPSMTVPVAHVLSNIGQPSMTLIDARAPERFSGETEPLDARAGHIPGALNRPMGLNLDQFGQFKAPDQLREEFGSLLQHRPVASVVHSCGSGVTACHNLFAMELAGMAPTRIYPGSWSEWVRDESRPVETGN